MGIGLSVVKWIIDSHGWKIEASSEYGKGACFRVKIRLPECSGRA
jgi:signal transduction histidine kinase